MNEQEQGRESGERREAGAPGGAEAGAPEAGAGTPGGTEGGPGQAGSGTTEQIREALRSVTDPELGINIVDLGLVYDIEVEDGAARVTMTLTSPGCPAGGQIMAGAKAAAESIEGVAEAVVSLVWKPFWTPERIDPKVRATLGI